MITIIVPLHCHFYKLHCIEKTRNFINCVDRPEGLLVLRNIELCLHHLPMVIGVVQRAFAFYKNGGSLDTEHTEFHIALI